MFKQMSAAERRVQQGDQRRRIRKRSQEHQVFDPDQTDGIRRRLKRERNDYRQDTLDKHALDDADDGCMRILRQRTTLS
jgi:hypothetical protein